MKKLLLSTAILGSIALAVPAAETSSSAASIESPQIRVQIGRGRHYRRYDRFNRRPRTTISTRVVGFGRFRTRETIRTTYLPNGRVITQVISRDRIRG